MNFWLTVFRQVGRNLRQTWPSQLMTLLTVSLSVLIFAFFYLVYTNMLNIGDKLGDDLRLIVYLDGGRQKITGHLLQDILVLGKLFDEAVVGLFLGNEMDLLDLIKIGDLSPELFLHFRAGLFFEIDNEPKVVSELIADVEHIGVNQIEEGKDQDGE